MSAIRKLVLAAFAAALVLSLVAGTAAANRSLESSETRVTALWTALTFTAAEFEAPVVCRVGITLSLSRRSIAKVAGTLMGTAAASVLSRETCSGGTGSALEEGRQRWPVVFNGFRGTLPAITGVDVELQRTAFLVSAAGGLARCLYEGTAKGTINLREGRVVSVTANETTALPLKTRLAGSLFCPGVGTFRGTSGTPTPATTVRLL